VATGKDAASKASKILSDPKSTKAQKEVAASALADAKKKGVTGKDAASKASKILSDPKSTKAQKEVAASALADAKKKGKK
jgi:hypothetical protein